MFNRGSAVARLGSARHFLTVFTQRPDIAQHFGIHGPNDPELLRGHHLYQQAQRAYLARKTAQASAITAISRCTQTFREARTAQSRLTALARLVITTSSERDRLALNGRRAEAVGSWRLQAEVFHANLTDNHRTLLAGVGVTPIELQRINDILPRLAEYHAACIAAKAAARAATEAKVTALRQLSNLISLWTGIARTLESDLPDLIHLLNMRPDRRRRPPTTATPPQPDPTDPPNPPHTTQRITTLGAPPATTFGATSQTNHPTTQSKHKPKSKPKHRKRRRLRHKRH